MKGKSVTLTFFRTPTFRWSGGIAISWLAFSWSGDFFGVTSFFSLFVLVRHRDCHRQLPLFSAGDCEFSEETVQENRFPATTLQERGIKIGSDFHRFHMWSRILLLHSVLVVALGPVECRTSDQIGTAGCLLGHGIFSMHHTVSDCSSC